MLIEDTNARISEVIFVLSFGEVAGSHRMTRINQLSCNQGRMVQAA